MAIPKRCFMPREYFLTGLLSLGSSPTFSIAASISCSDAICFIDERISKFLRPLYELRSAGFSRSRPTLGGKSISSQSFLFSIETYPWVGLIRPQTARISIVLPEPFWPSRPIIFLFSRDNVTSLRTVSFPISFVRCSTEMYDMFTHRQTLHF